jgi:hypothetical protein
MLTRKQFPMTLAACAQAAPLELSNDSFVLSVSAGPHGVWLGRLTAKPVSENLLFGDSDAILRSGTAILPEGGSTGFEIAARGMTGQPDRERSAHVLSLRS